MGPRVGLDRCGICRPPPGCDSRTVQPVASRPKEITGIYCESITKQVNTACGNVEEFVDVSNW